MPKANTSNANEGEQEDFNSQSAQGEFQDFEDDDDSQGGEETGGSSSTSGKTTQNRPVKRAGRRKINIEFIKDKSRRHITFSKRKAGIMKKAYELSTLTGTQVLLLVASETGHVYTFATPKLQPLITKTEGKNLIQACLNSPDPAPDQQGQAGTLGGDELTSTMPQTQFHQQQLHQHEPIEDERKAKKIKTEVKASAPSPYPSTPTPYPSHMAAPSHHSQSIPPHHAQSVSHHGGHHQHVHHQQQMHQHHLQSQQSLPGVPTSQTPTPNGVASGGYDLPTHPQSVQYGNPSAYSQHSLPQSGYSMHQHMQQMQGGGGVPPMRSLPPNYAQMGAYAQQHQQQPPLTALYQQMAQNNTPMTPSGHQKLTISPGTTGAAPLPPTSYSSQQQQSGASQSSQSAQASQSQAQSQAYQLPMQSSQQQNSQSQ